MITYDECLELIERGRRGRKKLAHNTWLYGPYLVDEDAGPFFDVVLHQTVVVTIFQTGLYVLNSGGWRTVTTKNRIGRYSPVCVFQNAGTWYLSNGRKFYDGVEVWAPDRRPLPPAKGDVATGFELVGEIAPGRYLYFTPRIAVG